MPSYVETNNKENIIISILIQEDLPDDHQIQLEVLLNHLLFALKIVIKNVIFLFLCICAGSKMSSFMYVFTFCRFVGCLSLYRQREMHRL
jgi:hypothetical protein